MNPLWWLLVGGFVGCVVLPAVIALLWAHGDRETRPQPPEGME